MPSTIPPDVFYAAPLLPASFERAVLPVDKPLAWTSFDVVKKLRGLLHVRKIGHAGTLDPMATGLLICLVGRATKLMESFMTLPKQYEGTLRLGQVTASYDTETDVVEEHPWEHLRTADLEGARSHFVGEIVQRAPMYSAVRVGGERLYKKARRGETVERPPRCVTITAFELLKRDGPDVAFRVTCSKGTYIRSLAHDFGRHLGVGAHLTTLRRTAIGPYSVDQAWRLESLEAAMHSREVS